MSLIPNTYNGLVSAVKSLAEDDSVEFQNYVPTAIFLTEERLIKEVDTEGVKTVVSTTATVSNPVLTKPTGYRLGFDVSYNTSTGRVFLTKKTDDFLQDYWPNATSVGRPKYYADKSNTEFQLAPAPASAYVFQTKHVAQVVHGSVSNQTNYFFDYCSDALLYGTMSNMAEFMKDYQVQQVWETKYERAIQGINNQGRRGRRDDGSPPKNRDTNMNTLREDN